MSPRKVIFRTLDLGADKFIASFGPLDEANPAMGLRAIRFCMQHPELFKTQLKAMPGPAPTATCRSCSP
jgi:Phosphoenolpyruvate-protein kinase (PTS system EI component in bacteria)